MRVKSIPEALHFLDGDAWFVFACITDDGKPGYICFSSQGHFIPGESGGMPKPYATHAQALHAVMSTFYAGEIDLTLAEVAEGVETITKDIQQTIH